MRTRLILVVSLLALTLGALFIARPVEGVPAPLSEQVLADSAHVIITGAAGRVFSSKEGETTHYLAEVTIERVEKGIDRAEIAVGETVLVGWHIIRQRIVTPGSAGHYDPYPTKGERVRIYARKTTNGSYEALFPNGFAKPAPLTALDGMNAEELRDELRTAQASNLAARSLDVIERLLALGWDATLAAQHSETARGLGDASRAATPMIARLAAAPNDETARRSLAVLVMEHQGDRDLVRRITSAARNHEAAWLMAAVGAITGNQRLLDRAIDLDPALGDTEDAVQPYALAITTAADAGDRDRALNLLARAREHLPAFATDWDALAALLEQPAP